jgi:general secretion pathway protein N
MASRAMMGRSTMRWCAACVAVTVTVPVAAFAVTTPTITDVSDEPVETALPSASLGQPQKSPQPVQPSPPPSDNLLWGIPLKELTNTRERPLFSSSRRAPPPVVVGPPVVVVAPPQKPKEPERPQLSLVGTIVNGDDGYGIFIDQANNTPVRIQINSSYRGWTLQSIKSGIVRFEKDRENAEIEFPKAATEKRAGLAGILAATGATLRSLAPRLGISGQPSAPDAKSETGAFPPPRRAFGDPSPAPDRN